MPAVDLFKAVAAQLIVLHHLAFYGPMSDVVAEVWPQAIEWLARHARLAVQVFLVVAGYLAARQLAPGGRLSLGSAPGRQLAHLAELAALGNAAPGATLASTRTGGECARATEVFAVLRERYLRLVLPYAAALAFTLACAALARLWLQHASIPPAPEWPQFAAHLFLLQDLLGFDALSAGVWYVAIDFQLFAVLLAVLWAARTLERALGTRRPLAPWAVAALSLASLFYFNRIGAWDVAAPYFLAAYGLGAMAAWWGAAAAQAGALSRRAAAPAAAAQGRLHSVLFGVVAAGVVIALAIDWRSRIALAAVVAVVLAAAASWRFCLPRGAQQVVEWASRTSYSLFLVHFAVCLLVNALFTRFMPAAPWVQGLGMLLAWAASVACAALLHHWVEVPALRWVTGLRARAPFGRRGGEGREALASPSVL